MALKVLLFQKTPEGALLLAIPASQKASTNHASGSQLRAFLEEGQVLHLRLGQLLRLVLAQGSHLFHFVVLSLQLVLNYFASVVHLREQGVAPAIHRSGH